VGRAITADESVINVLEHFDQNEEGKTRDRFEVAFVVALELKEPKFRATGRMVAVADLRKPSGRAARTVSLSMVVVVG
jgi:hypothetical protein